LLNYSNLREIQKKEMESAAITPLEDDFYEKVSELLKKKKESAVKSQSILEIREYENMKKIIISIQSKREEKMVLMALRGETEGKGLTSEEKKMVDELSKTIQKYRGSMDISTEEEKEDVKKKTVRIIKHIEQYKGIDNDLYGPFKEGEEVLLPAGEAEWLLKAKMAELL